MDSCPCGSGKCYADCCEPYINGSQSPQTAVALMRSRYCAYVETEIDYIYKTTHKAQRNKFNRKDSEVWSRKTDWHSLEIRNTEFGGPEDQTGMVEFIAHYRNKGKLACHHEVAEFKRDGERWYFFDGHAPKYEQVKREGTKVGRNDPCPCESGKKFKKCCG